MPGKLLEGLSQDVHLHTEAFAGAFAAARPFRHVVIDDFFDPGMAARLADSFPAFDTRLAVNEDGVVGGKAVNEKVRKLGPDWRQLDELVKSEDFRVLVGRITGIGDLCYDPYYFGGGTHENLHGQRLNAHIDFNYHPITRQHRRLNLIVYLNREWDEAWGGSIRLHRDPYLPEARDEIVSIAPLFNRCVIFETTEHSWHGFKRIDIPEARRRLSRRSFALYYYTDVRPAAEVAPEHSTIYVEEHLPTEIGVGRTLSAADHELLLELLASRDQHLKRLYGHLKFLNQSMERLRDARSIDALLQAPLPSAGQLASSSESAPEAWLLAEISVREDAIRRLRARVTELEASTSWRITAPMRALKSWFRR